VTASRKETAYPAYRVRQSNSRHDAIRRYEKASYMRAVGKFFASCDKVYQKEYQSAADKSAVKGRARLFIYYKLSALLYVVESLKKHRRAISQSHRKHAAQNREGLILGLYAHLVGKCTKHEKACRNGYAKTYIVRGHSQKYLIGIHSLSSYVKMRKPLCPQGKRACNTVIHRPFSFPHIPRGL
jgi:hypothetical protein